MSASIDRHILSYFQCIIVVIWIKKKVHRTRIKCLLQNLRLSLAVVLLCNVPAPADEKCYFHSFKLCMYKTSSDTTFLNTVAALTVHQVTLKLAKCKLNQKR